jgi:hypothetical protein
MKNIFLSVVVISALVIAGVGGTLADFSDSEEEIGDTLQAGSMDLKVNGTDDPNVMPYALRGMVPEKWYDFSKTVANEGTIDGWLYIHIKNVVCQETDDKGFKPEPEIVAEQGGKHGQEIVPALGERCDMEKHIEVELWYGSEADFQNDKVQIDLSQYDKDRNGKIKLSELMCEQLLIGQLWQCGEPYRLNFKFMLQDVPEEYYGLDIFDETDPNEVMFDHWPTNCYMGDTVSFDILLMLLQTDYEPPGS